MDQFKPESCHGTEFKISWIWAKIDLTILEKHLKKQPEFHVNWSYFLKACFLPIIIILFTKIYQAIFDLLKRNIFKNIGVSTSRYTMFTFFSLEFEIIHGFTIDAVELVWIAKMCCDIFWNQMFQKWLVPWNAISTYF